MTQTDTSKPGVQTDIPNKVAAAARYVGSNFTGALTLAVVMGAMSPEQSQAVIQAFHDMYDATQDFVGAFAKVWYIVFPLAAVYLGKLGVSSSGFGAMMDKVLSAAKSGNRDAQVALVSAASSPEIGTRAIINSALATAETPANVVSTTAAVPPINKGS